MSLSKESSGEEDRLIHGHRIPALTIAGIAGKLCFPVRRNSRILPDVKPMKLKAWRANNG